MALITPALAQGAAVESAAAHNAKAAFVYSAQATQNAIVKSLDANLTAQRRKIDALGAQLAAARADLKSARAGAGALRARIMAIEVEAGAAQERFASELAQRDADYARELAALRTAADTILATPDGLSALELNNEGDWEGVKRIEAVLRATRQKNRDLASAADARAFAVLAMDNRDKGKETTAAVLVRYEEIVALDPGDYGDWFQLAQLRLDNGDLAGSERAARETLVLAGDDRERAVAYVSIGDIVLQRGARDEAFELFSKGIALRRGLVASQPGLETALRDLTINLDRIGDVLYARGDLVGAEKAYLESYDIRKPLAAKINGPMFDNDVAISLFKNADLHLARGNRAAAADGFREALALQRKVLADDPDSQSRKRSLIVTLNRLGDLAGDDGDLVGAARYYDEGLDISRNAVAADRGSASARREFSVALNKRGNILLETDPAAALAVYREALELARGLLKETPDSIENRRDISVSLGKIGGTLLTLGDETNALAVFQEAYLIDQAAFDWDPDQPDARRDLMNSLYSLALLDAPGFPWSRVTAFMEDMKARGLLGDDARFLERAYRKAAGTP